MVRIAGAQVVLTADATIGSGNLAYENQDIIIRGCTVTIDGAHSFNSLTLERNAQGSVAGRITHSLAFADGPVRGMRLTIAGNLTIQDDAPQTARNGIDVSGRGDGAGPGQGVPAWQFPGSA